MPSSINNEIDGEKWLYSIVRHVAACGRAFVIGKKYIPSVSAKIETSRRLLQMGIHM